MPLKSRFGAICFKLFEQCLYSGFAHAADPRFSGFLWIFAFFRWILGSGRCPSGEISKFCFRWAPGEPEMIFKSPDQAPGQLRIFFVNQRVFISPREQPPIFTFFKKSNLQNYLNIPLHQKAAHRNFIINGFSFVEFCVTRAKLHFGEFSNLTFQAVSCLLLFLIF